MAIIQNDVNTEAKTLGIQIVDVRIKRADLPQANSEAIYKRMQTEREREAKEFRAQGAEIAQKIRSTADKDVTVLLAEANKKSEIMKGEGDGLRNKIFADAFGKDNEYVADTFSECFPYVDSMKSAISIAFIPFILMTSAL